MKDGLVAFYSGSGIGLAIGVMMGLAVSPTVGVIIGTLAAALAVLLGLNDGLFSNNKAIRVGSFGFALVIGGFLGIFLRTHNLLSPSPQELMTSYLALGYDKPMALDLVAYKEFGIINKQWKLADTQITTSTGSSEEDGKSTTTTVSGNLTRSAHASVFFSAEVELSSCSNLEDMEELEVRELVNNFVKEKGAWREMAELAAQNLAASSRKDFLLAARSSLCGQSTDAVIASSCDSLKPLTRNVTLKEIRLAFVSSKGIWASLAQEIGKTEIPEMDQATALWITKTSLCKYSEK